MSADNIALLTKQILATSDPTKWSGQGYGSAQANAADMAKILDGIGITDINQFGQIQKVIPASEQQFEGGDGFTSVMVPEHTVTVFGNKATNQEVPNTYGERQTDNYFGGTYAGSGNTGYGVQFDAQGRPQFYTSGASSSDMGAIRPFLTMAGMALGAPYLSELLAGGGAAGATAADLAAADMAGGLVPEFGTNAAYSGFMSSAMTPEAIAALGTTVAASPEVIGSGALLTDAAAAAANTASTGLTASQIANLAKAGINVAGLLAATNAVTNKGTTTTPAAPITYSGGGAGGYSPDYFRQVQSIYNSLMPGVPRDVATPLQQWYSTEFNPGASVTGSLFGDMTSGTAAKTTPAAVKPVTTPVVKPVTTTTPTTTAPTGSAAYNWATKQGGMTGQQYLNNINQWVLDNPNASLADINAIKSQLGVSDTDVQTALGQSNFSDATKYALTHNMGLSDVNQNIVNWINANPAATNAQIQAEQAKYSISDADVARALTEQNASAAKEYAIIHDMGLDQYYKNITNAAQSGISPTEAVAQMKQYGVSPVDVQTAYSMFAPKAGLTLDEVLAAYNK